MTLGEVKMRLTGIVAAGALLGLVSGLLMMVILAPWLRTHRFWEHISGVTNIFLVRDSFCRLYWSYCGVLVGAPISFLTGVQALGLTDDELSDVPGEKKSSFRKCSVRCRSGWLAMLALIPFATPVMATCFRITSTLIAALILIFAFIVIKNFLIPALLSGRSILYSIVNLFIWFEYLKRGRDAFSGKIYSGKFDFVMNMIIIVAMIVVFTLGTLMLRAVCGGLAGWILSLTIPACCTGFTFTFALIIAILLMIAAVFVFDGFLSLTGKVNLPEADISNYTSRQFSDKYGEMHEVREGSYHGDTSYTFYDENKRRHEIYRDGDDPDEYCDLVTGDRYVKDYAGNFKKK